jgi:endonuclease YncB( thermonuclease family)
MRRRHRKTSVWWLLPVVLVVGYFSRGRAPTPPAAVSTPVPAKAPTPRVERPAPPPPRERSSDRKILGRVVGVTDGDTITVLDENKKQIKVRLDAIDAPESGQPFGQAAKRALSEMVFGKDVIVHKKKEDRWGRTIGHVIVDGVDTNLAMLEAGMAWHYKEYDRNRRLSEAESAARKAKIGLWQDARALPPWEWRAAERAKQKVIPQ